MEPRKPWTVMVYLAADNNLFTFGVDSLRQMKAAARANINILAQFDTGPRPAKRYFFNGQELIGPIEHNRVKTVANTDADPQNLADFIEWGADNYPADRYFVVIWGHGGGVDDDFPRAPDNSFVPRHALLSLFTSTSGKSSSIAISDFAKNSTQAFPKNSTQAFPRGTADDEATRVLADHVQEVLSPSLQEIVDVLKIGDDALHNAVIGALKQGVGHALTKNVLDEIRNLGKSDKSSLSPAQVQRLSQLRKGILKVLELDAQGQLQKGALKILSQGLLNALQRGVADALQAGVLYELQKAVLIGLDRNNTGAALEGICSAALSAVLRFLENGILEVQHSGTLDALQTRALTPIKSVAFADHPESFLTNLDLKAALNQAAEKIGQKIDILGMDACDMNMIEIGYEVRDAVDFMVASQGDIPDASWPYDRIIEKLTAHPDWPTKQLARETVVEYVSAYEDYVNEPITAADPPTLPEPVTLAAIDLDRLQRMTPLFRRLVRDLKSAARSFEGRQAILLARSRGANFNLNQFVDLISFCEALTGATGNGPQARRAPPQKVLSTNPALRQLSRTAKKMLGPLTAIIVENRTSDQNPMTNGTSIYFPLFDSQQEEHEKRLGSLYKLLDFARATGWNVFVSEFLRLQKKDLAVAKVLVKSNGKSPHSSPSGKLVAQLNKAEKQSKIAASELKAVAQTSKTTASPVNGALNGAAQMSKAVAEAVVEVSRNGGH